MNKLFVYGIFLDEKQRLAFGMSKPQYATVQGYATRGIEISGNTIVEAVPDERYTLTGLVVDVLHHISPSGIGSIDNWGRLDSLEAGYDRIKVRTTDGEYCWMYVAK